MPCVGTSSGEKGGGRGVACSAFWMVSSSSSRGVTRAEAPLNLRSRAAFCEGDAILGLLCDVRVAELPARTGRVAGGRA